MTGAERGFLLLTSQLGNPQRKPLTTAQLRTLAQRVRSAPHTPEDRELEARDLAALGYRPEMVQRILALLDEEELLSSYLRRAAKKDCIPLTRCTPEYPASALKLAPDAPGCLWARGDLSLLEKPAIALVGSRELSAPNREFARRVGMEAARQGYVLVSGNARGADREAQNAALAAGGSVISVIADSLEEKQKQAHVLYLSEEGFDLPFSMIRALSRNRVIHALGQCTVVAQCTLGSGGAWDGSVKNLKHGWSPLFCWQDGSEAVAQLCDMGANSISFDNLKDISSILHENPNFFKI